MSIEWGGDLIEGLEALRNRVRDGNDEALLAGADVIMQRSQMLVPKAPKRPSDDTPTLFSTAHTRVSGENTVAMEYLSVYAHWQHEHLWFKHPHGGQAKFLETAMLEKGAEAINVIGEHILGRF